MLEHVLAAHIVGGIASCRGDGKLAATALKRVLDRIEDEFDQPLTLDHLAGEACLSTFHFARSFKRSTGMAPHRYVLARKIERAKRQLMMTDSTVEEIATALGFENLHHFRRQFQAQLGALPGPFEMWRAARSQQGNISSIKARIEPASQFSIWQSFDGHRRIGWHVSVRSLCRIGGGWRLRECLWSSRHCDVLSGRTSARDKDREPLTGDEN